MNPEDSAFPSKSEYETEDKKGAHSGGWHDGPETVKVFSPGLTKRELFAAIAMFGNEDDSSLFTGVDIAAVMEMPYDRLTIRDRQIGIARIRARRAIIEAETLLAELSKGAE